MRDDEGWSPRVHALWIAGEARTGNNMTRHPDNPQRVSLDFLRQLDTEPPGTWLGQSKLNGWRKIADNTDGTWHYGAKHTTGDAAKPLPDTLRTEFEALAWQKGIVLDMEWLGNRQTTIITRHSLHIFDILTHEGQWLGSMGYERRLEVLAAVCKQAGVSDPDHSEAESDVFLVPTWTNPGLVDRFIEQMENPLSEGLVVRQRHSGLIGSFTSPATNPQMLKVKFEEKVPSGMAQHQRRK